MTTTAIVLANIPSSRLGISNHSSVFDNRFIRLALDYCSDSNNVVLALSKDLIQSEHEREKPKNCTVKFLPETQGALATVGLVLDLIPEVGNIVIVPTNASISETLYDFVDFMVKKHAAVGMAVINSTSKELSYVSEVGGVIVEIHEKEVVGSLACSGIYFFSSKEVLLKCIHWSLLNDVRKNGLLYIAPAINYCITKGLRVIPFPVRQDGYERHSYEIG
jgi:hypothetical protein